METAVQRNKITLSQFTYTFVPFAVLLMAALIVPELPQILDYHRPIYTIHSLVYYRTVFTIWLTIAFMIPALCLFFLPGESDKKNNYWLLFWTFSYLAYLVHFYYAVGVIFHGSLSEVYAKQGVLIATSNLLVTAWWGFDLILAWFVKSDAKWIKNQRIGAHIYIPLTFFVSAVVIKQGVVRALGIVMTATMLLSIIWRLIKRKQERIEASPSVAA
jgi:preprotein translocase subunit SecG